MDFKYAWIVTMALGLSIVTVSAQADTTSLTKLLDAGQSLVCTYEKKEPNGKQSGTIYVAGRKIGGEIQVSSIEGTYLMNTLYTDGWQYIWGGPLGETQGMKIQVSALHAQGSPEATHGPDLNEDLDYQCKPWTVDASKFVLPSNVQFIDAAGMMPNTAMKSAATGGGGMDMHAMQCAACEQVPEEERAECKQALGC